RSFASLPRLYAGYAAFFLAVTVLSGSWLRSAFVVSGALGDFQFQHALHAHSHLALFGWATMGIFALIAARTRLEVEAPWMRLHAHGVAAASAAAFVGFLLGGYNATTIAISIVHVLLWTI